MNLIFENLNLVVGVLAVLVAAGLIAFMALRKPLNDRDKAEHLAMQPANRGIRSMAELETAKSIRKNKDGTYTVVFPTRGSYKVNIVTEQVTKL